MCVSSRVTQPFRVASNMAADAASETAKDPSSSKFMEVWDTNWYLNFAFKNPDTPQNRYELRNFHEFYSQIVPSGFDNLRIIDYGAGPCIYSFISACPRAKEIVSADFNPPNQKAVELWQKKDPEGFNWTPFIEYVVKKLEGKGDEEVTHREKDLREKVTLVPCDFRTENIIALPAVASHGPPYDVITSCFTVEGVVDTEDDYEKVVMKLSRKLAPGGYLILNGWTVRMSREAATMSCDQLPQGLTADELDEALDESLSVSPKFVRECMAKAGLEVVKADMSGPDDADEGGPERYHFVVGRAPK